MSDQRWADLLSQERNRINSVEKARKCLFAFAELRDYEIQLAPRTEKNSIVEARNSSFYSWRPATTNDWKLNVVSDRTGWTFTCTFLTDPVIKSCYQYEIRVNRGGLIAAKQVTMVFIHGGYK